MNDPISQVLVGTVSNALWAIVAMSGSAVGRELRALVRTSDAWQEKAIDDAVERVIRSIRGPSDQKERLAVYLRSPEAEAVTRQVFATSIFKDHSNIAEIKREFVVSLSQHMGAVGFEELGNLIFEALVSIVEETLRDETQNNVLAAHEALAAVRHRALIDEIANLKKNLVFLTSHQEINISSVLEFEVKYREQISCVHGEIKPPQLDTGKRVPIDEIFVAPRIERIARDKKEAPQPVPFASFLSTLYRAVLLGNPGGANQLSRQKYPTTSLRIMRRDCSLAER